MILITKTLYLVLLLLPLAYGKSEEAVLPTLNGGCITSGNQAIQYEDIPAPMFATAATGGNCGGVYSYQWQWSRDNIIFYDIPGATGQNATFPHPITNYGLGVSLPETVYIQRRTICGAEVEYTMSVTITRGAVFYNVDLSGTYYPNDCQPGETPQPVYINVPPNTFTSMISIQDANDLAAAWAQGEANEIGVCESNVSIYYTNNSPGNVIYVTMTNTTTWQQYYFEIYYSSGTLGSVPAGIYDIEFYDYDGWYYRSYSAGCFAYGSGYSPVYLYGTTFDANCSNTIEVYGW